MSKLATQLTLKFEQTLDLPDQSSEFSIIDFFNRHHWAWRECDRGAIGISIAKGKILSNLKAWIDRRPQPDFIHYEQFLKDKGLTEARANKLINIYQVYYRWIKDGGDPNLQALERMTEDGFVLFTQAPIEVQTIAIDTDADRKIDKSVITDLNNQHQAKISLLLPEAVRSRVNNDEIPPKAIVPLVKNLAKLPETHREEFQQQLEDKPDQETIKNVALECKLAAKAIEAANRINGFELEFSKMLEEARGKGVVALDEVARILTWIAEVEHYEANLKAKLSQIQDKQKYFEFGSYGNYPTFNTLLDNWLQERQS